MSMKSKKGYQLNVDFNAVSGKDAIDAFEAYTNKGFHVVDFPLDRFKYAEGMTVERFKNLKEKYEEILAKVDAKG